MDSRRRAMNVNTFCVTENHDLALARVLQSGCDHRLTTTSAFT